MFHKKSCFWNFRRNPQENTFAGVSFLAKLHTTGLICRASANYCFCKWISFLHNLLIKLFFLHVRFATSSRKTFSEKHLWLGSPRENRRNFVEVLKSPFKFTLTFRRPHNHTFLYLKLYFFQWNLSKAL